MRQLKDLGLIIAYELHGFRSYLFMSLTRAVFFIALYQASWQTVNTERACQLKIFLERFLFTTVFPKAHEQIFIEANRDGNCNKFICPCCLPRFHNFRYKELERKVVGITAAMLTKCLKELEIMCFYR